jgi:hypothetical protein
MRGNVKVLVAIAIIAAAAPLTMAARRQSADEAEIRRVITEYYFEAGRTGDSASMRQGFDVARAHMFFVQADTLVDVPIPEYIRRAGANRARPDFRPDNNTRRIVMVDVTRTAAVAKLEIVTPTSLLTDYMSLLKIGGRWQIVNKIFDRQMTSRS